MSQPLTYWERTAAGLRAELARQRKSRTELAAVLGRNRNYVSARVNGHQPFPLDELETAANWLQVPVEQLSKKATR